MTDNELLLTMSDMMDAKLNPIKNDIKDMNLLLENVVMPRLQDIEACYTSTYRRYASGIQEMDSLKDDMDIIKKVVEEHSEKLQKSA